MCFSAKSSFVASFLLSVIGFLTVKKNTIRRELPYALFPLVFSLQQFIEGVLWVFLVNNSGTNTSFLVVSFVFIAQVFWPIWVPFSFWLADKPKFQKSFLSFLLAIGFLSGLINFIQLFTSETVAKSSMNHIQYFAKNASPVGSMGFVFYLFATILPPFVSSLKNTGFIGFLLFSSFITSYFLYQDYIISVWCYFASIVSVFIYFSIETNTKNIIIARDK